MRRAHAVRLLTLGKGEEPWTCAHAPLLLACTFATLAPGSSLYAAEREGRGAGEARRALLTLYDFTRGVRRGEVRGGAVIGTLGGERA